MSKKPTIDQLHNSGDFELLATVEHARIKDFVLDQVIDDRKFVPFYMVYQTLMFLVGLFLLSRAIVLAFRGDTIYFTITILAVVFSLSVLVAFHELLHGLVLKLAGAPKVRFGRVPGRFIFYAEADKFVITRKPFLWVAFTPLVVVQIVTIIFTVLWFTKPLVYFPVMVMAIHSFFCAGDVALVTLFYKYPGREVYTYDNHDEKKGYYFADNQANSTSN